MFCFSWGCNHEEDARASYIALQHQAHEEFNLELSGLRVNPQYPHLGASADGVVSCRCCGAGVVEIKCPYCARDECAESAPFLEKESEVFRLKQDHAHYFQVQMQLFVYDVTHADFVVWTQKDPSKPHIERISPDPLFFQEQLEKVNIFYKKVILPNLLAKTLLAPQTKSTTRPGDTCFCKEPPSGDMLVCQSGFCKVKQFHLACMKLVKVPKRYICPPCRTIINREKREKRKQSKE